MTSAAGSLRATLSDLGWLSFGRFFGDAATFVLLVVVSRWHGEERLGLYAIAMAYAMFFAIAADLGLYTLFIKEASHGQDPVQAVFGKVFSLGLGLTLLAFLALLATLMLAPLSPTTRIVVFVVGLQQLIYKLVEGCAAVFIVLHQTHVSSTLEVLAKSATALAAAATIVAGASLPVALVVLPCVAVVQLAAIYWLLGGRIGWPPLTAHPRDLLPLLRRIVSYAASALQVPIYARADVITIGLLMSTAAVGIYTWIPRMG